MLVEQVKIDQLYPTARPLFGPAPSKRRRSPVSLFAWLIAGAIAVLTGQRIVYWIDRNL